MPGARSPRPPGWYRDPEDPTCVRHWAGQGWSSRRRVRPSWDLPDSDWVAPPLPADTGGPVLDGPARSAGLPAIAAVTSRPTRPRGNPSAGTTAAPGVMVPAGRPLRAELATPAAAWVGRRRPLLVLAGLTALAVLALVTSVAVTRPSRAVPWTEDAPQFVTDANRLCTSLLPGFRPPAAPAMTSGVASPSAATVRRWANQVTAVAQRLRTLPSAPDDVVRLNAWLGEWTTYGADELRYAAWLQANPAPTGATAPSGQDLSDQADHDALAADGFAAANGLDHCNLATPAG